MHIIAGILFTLVGGMGVVLQLITLPGIWLIVLAGVLYQGIAIGAGVPPPFTWWTLGIALALGVLGEVIELVTGALGAAAGGGRTRGAAGAMLGSIMGAVIGIFVFAFIPIIGPLIGALLGAALGAFVGELSYGDRTAGQATMPAVGAAVGRVAGVMAKLVLAVTIWVMLSIDAFL
ncbi:MAG: DUF456 family protein [Phycisphaerae bacterium]|nr:DUF456 family protein [Phycisphaerae bacterium]